MSTVGLTHRGQTYVLLWYDGVTLPEVMQAVSEWVDDEDLEFDAAAGMEALRSVGRLFDLIEART